VGLRLLQRGTGEGRHGGDALIRIVGLRHVEPPLEVGLISP
jgi:hypothetical protein